MDLGTVSLTLVLLVLLALAFDFMNGFHDAANSIATVVSTGVLRPHHAVAFAAFFNFVAIAVFHLKVAATVGKGIVEPGVVDHHVVFGALCGAISELFRNEQDVRQLIKMKAVYEALESATDKCQDVANTIESVVLENS